MSLKILKSPKKSCGVFFVVLFHVGEVVFLCSMLEASAAILSIFKRGENREAWQMAGQQAAPKILDLCCGQGVFRGHQELYF